LKGNFETEKGVLILMMPVVKSMDVIVIEVCLVWG